MKNDPQGDNRSVKNHYGDHHMSRIVEEIHRVGENHQGSDVDTHHHRHLADQDAGAIGEHPMVRNEQFSQLYRQFATARCPVPRVGRRPPESDPCGSRGGWHGQAESTELARAERPRGADHEPAPRVGRMPPHPPASAANPCQLYCHAMRTD